MAAVIATPNGVSMKLMSAIQEMVEGRLKQHYPRFKGTTVLVELLNGFSFFIEMKGREGTFDDESREVLRRFFTGDFKDEVKTLFEGHLDWDLRVHTNPRSRSTSCCGWQVSCRNKEIEVDLPPAANQQSVNHAVESLAG